MRCPKEGLRVKFVPNPASLMLYSRTYGTPPKGATGSVTSIPVPGGKKTCMPGPGGGLVYVEWDNWGVLSVSSHDIETVSAKRKARKR
jgi:hypothetical protein